MIKRFSVQLIIRILLLLASCLLVAYLFGKGYWFSLAGMSGLIIFQVFTLYRYVNDTNYSLSKFLEALKSEDYSTYFSPGSKGHSFTDLYRDFNTIIGIYKKNKLEKEAQHKHFQQILEHVPLGIISIHQKDLEDEETQKEILFFNASAGNILQQARHKYWNRLERQLPWFGEAVRKLANGGKRLLEVDMGGDRKQLSLNVIKVRFIDHSRLIVSFQDINSEIEQKEIEAWNNVIRVLSHEMMNSFTPVSSLATTIKSMTEDDQGLVLPKEEMDGETIEDINMAATTIHKRSKGLMEFVNDYRLISQVPQPKLEVVGIQEFLTGIHALMKAEIGSRNIDFQLGDIPSRAVLQMDPRMIEQVLINLVGNSIHALHEQENPMIKIDYEEKLSSGSITVEDNGHGIPKEIQRQIFVPFFTTRKKGSGIGLSLSKSIMRQHQGHILLNSEKGKGARISLVFKKEV